MRDSENAPASAWRSSAAVLVYLAATFLLAAFLSSGLFAALREVETPWIRSALEEPGRVVRRVLAAVALLLFFPMIRACGWRGWRDAGWTGVSRNVAKLDLSIGLAAGLAALAVPALIHLAAGQRHFDQGLVVRLVPLRLALFALSAAAVALVEESVSRGILFRVLARSWTAVPAAVATSALFAYAHFIDPAVPMSDAGAGAAAFSIFRQLLTALPPDPMSRLQGLNLFLLGLLLCAVVHRRRTVWGAAGFHAGCVFAMKINGLFSDRSEGAALLHPLLGTRSDVTDSGLTAFLLAVFVAAALALPRPGRDPAPDTT